MKPALSLPKLIILFLALLSIGCASPLKSKRFDEASPESVAVVTGYSVKVVDRYQYLATEVLGTGVAVVTMGINLGDFLTSGVLSNLTEESLKSLVEGEESGFSEQIGLKAANIIEQQLELLGYESEVLSIQPKEFEYWESAFSNTEDFVTALPSRYPEIDDANGADVILFVEFELVASVNQTDKGLEDLKIHESRSRFIAINPRSDQNPVYFGGDLITEDYEGPKISMALTKLLTLDEWPGKTADDAEEFRKWKAEKKKNFDLGNGLDNPFFRRRSSR